MLHTIKSKKVKNFLREEDSS